MKHTAETLQQVDRVFVRRRGRRLVYFAGCDYYRLASHPRVLAAVRRGLKAFGLNVASSRKTTGNHSLYERLERELARFFHAQRAVLVDNGYMTNLAVAQALRGEFTHVLMDARSHTSVADAAVLLGATVVPFAHRDVADFTRQLRGLGRGARPIVFTDGMFSHDGSVAPLAEYLAVLPARAALLVDDAHGAGVLGEAGQGTPSHCGVQDARVIQTVTLSKAFGAFGGAIVGSRAVAEAVLARSRCFTGATPVPLPLAAGALEALHIFRANPSLQARLHANAAWLKERLRAGGMELPDAPGPIVPVIPVSAKEAARLKRRLLAAGIHPPFIRYPGGPEGGFFRFVVSSEHTRAQLASLAGALTSR
ncbi:MAG: pyridoxal phosphate-dependent aminotransferase family protein [Verrucomicrobia bacterium]|nr:pyridoxal phosphate-dependent aminotransferase family protein [Verrucomicrobiota bacterium]